MSQNTATRIEDHPNVVSYTDLDGYGQDEPTARLVLLVDGKQWPVSLYEYSETYNHGDGGDWDYDEDQHYEARVDGTFRNAIVLGQTCRYSDARCFTAAIDELVRDLERQPE